MPPTIIKVPKFLPDGSVNPAWFEEREKNRRKIARNYRNRNREKCIQKCREWYYGNHKRTLEWHKEYRKQLKAQVIAAYGGKCICCGEAIPEFLTIDHVPGYHNMHPDERGPVRKINGRSASSATALYLWLRKNGFPQKDFACACFNCNLGKSDRGICPHKANQEIETGGLQ